MSARCVREPDRPARQPALDRRPPSRPSMPTGSPRRHRRGPWSRLRLPPTSRPARTPTRPWPDAPAPDKRTYGAWEMIATTIRDASVTRAGRGIEPPADGLIEPTSPRAASSDPATSVEFQAAMSSSGRTMARRSPRRRRAPVGSVEGQDPAAQHRRGPGRRQHDARPRRGGPQGTCTAWKLTTSTGDPAPAVSSAADEARLTVLAVTSPARHAIAHASGPPSKVGDKTVPLPRRSR